MNKGLQQPAVGQVERRGCAGRKGRKIMTIKNAWTDTIDAQRASLDVRAKIIYELSEENIRLKSVISRRTTLCDNQYREIKRLRGFLETIHKEHLAKKTQG